MSLDGVCNNKIFMSGMSASVGLTVFLFTFLLWPAITDVQDAQAANKIKIAENNIPELKQYLYNEFSEQKQRYNELEQLINQKTTENQNLIYQNYRILCQIAEGQC